MIKNSKNFLKHPVSSLQNLKMFLKIAKKPRGCRLFRKGIVSYKVVAYRRGLRGFFVDFCFLFFASTVILDVLILARDMYLRSNLGPFHHSDGLIKMLIVKQISSKYQHTYMRSSIIRKNKKYGFLDLRNICTATTDELFCDKNGGA